MGGGSMYNFSSRSYDYQSLFSDNHPRMETGYEETCQSIMGQYSIRNSSFKLNCNKSLNYLQKLENREHTDIKQAQGTLYLYLWLYDKELKNVAYKGNSIDIYMKLLNLCFFNLHNNILTIYQSKVRTENFEILKNLYDLYYKFDKIEHDNECKETKYECAKECVKLYKECIEICNQKYNVDYCNELENFRNEFNKYISSENQCKDKDLYIPSNIFASKSVILLIPLVSLLVLSTFFFILYKFTPFGPWFRDRSRRKKKFYNNIANEEPEILHASRTNKMSEIKPYNISYISM
ncbi:PIR protein [Plasmodium vivax]|uniref:VIR protein n=1 Tax=Plasmodium vivax TaxID=5855 RepID=A0A565A6D7_PLAVI|nr:PIR protein [Plasmodium vivax]